MPRKLGQIAGKKEGAPMQHILKNPHVGPKRLPGSQGPTSKGYGRTAGVGSLGSMPSMPSMDPTQMMQLGQILKMTGDKPAEKKKQHHWHRHPEKKDGEGNVTNYEEIKRGPAPVEEDVEHIHALGKEHVKVGQIIDFKLPDGTEGEAIVTDYGPKGVTAKDGEGQIVRVFYEEIEGVRKPKPEKKPKPKGLTINV